MLERNGERACTYNSRFIYYQYKGGDICRINLVDNTFIVQIKQHTALSFIDLNRSFSLLREPSYRKQVKPATIVTKMNKCIWHQSCFNKAMFYSHTCMTCREGCSSKLAVGIVRNDQVEQICPTMKVEFPQCKHTVGS